MNRPEPYGIQGFIYGYQYFHCSHLVCGRGPKLRRQRHPPPQPVSHLTIRLSNAQGKFKM